MPLPLIAWGIGMGGAAAYKTLFSVEKEEGDEGEGPPTLVSRGRRYTVYFPIGKPLCCGMGDESNLCA